MKENYEEKLMENAGLSLDMVNSVLKGGPFDDTKIKIASASITQYHRFLATKTNNKAIDFAMARVIAKDRTELKKLLPK
jgi:hypothetical protein